MKQTIKVNPAILQWARLERGYSLDEVAQKLEKSTHAINDWEIESESPTYGELKKIANLYKRQISVFFLPEVPKKTKTPKDRRNLKVNERHLSPETLMAIRRASRNLEIARKLGDTNQLEAEYLWISEVRSHHQSAKLSAREIRKLLGVTIEAQLKMSDSQRALKVWRDKIEEQLGIYTFSQLMTYGEIDGFSYTEDGYPYGITLNSRNTKNRNIFTLFHEIAHIIEGDSGLCLVSEESAINDNIERRCDSFAAEFLMPQDAMKTPVDLEEAKTFASEFCVSTEAYVRRLYSLKAINETTKSKYIKELYKHPLKPKKKGEMKISPMVMSKSRSGLKFFELVVDAHNSGRLTSSQAADVLKLRPTSVEAL